MDQRAFRNRRPGLMVPPACYGAVALLLTIGAPGLAARICFAVALALALILAVRSWNAGVVLSARGVTLRGRLRTRRLAWAQIRGASTAPMETMSPLGVRFGYVNLVLRLRTEERVAFPELSAREAEPGPVAAAVAEIQRRLVTAGG